MICLESKFKQGWSKQLILSQRTHIFSIEWRRDFIVHPSSKTSSTTKPKWCLNLLEISKQKSTISQKNWLRYYVEIGENFCRLPCICNCIGIFKDTSRLSRIYGQHWPFCSCHHLVIMHAWMTSWRPHIYSKVTVIVEKNNVKDFFSVSLPMKLLFFLVLC